MVTSQSQFKRCNSCKRNLTINQFGFCAKSKDQLNPICKACRNYKRRCNYHGSSCFEPIILPVLENNRQILTKHRDRKLIKLIGRRWDTDELLKVVIEKASEFFIIEISYDDQLVGRVYISLDHNADPLNFLLFTIKTLKLSLNETSNTR